MPVKGEKNVGRPRGPLKGETEQARALAQWLRDLTVGKTIRDLAEENRYQKTSWSDLLNGTKLPPLWLVTELVTKYASAEARDQELSEGTRLLHAAERAALGKEVVSDVRSHRTTSSEAELAILLDQARTGQLEAERAVFAVHNLVFLLMALLASLTDRCSKLESQVQTAREQGRQDALSALAEDLEQSRARKEKAGAQLKEARREREQAEEIRVAALLIVEQHLLAVSANNQKDVASAGQQQMPQPPPAQGTASSPPDLLEYDIALEGTEDQISVIRSDLGRLREQVAGTTEGLSTPAEADNGQTEAAHGGATGRDYGTDGPQPYSWDNAYYSAYDPFGPYPGYSVGYGYESSNSFTETPYGTYEPHPHSEPKPPPTSGFVFEDAEDDEPEPPTDPHNNSARGDGASGPRSTAAESSAAQPTPNPGWLQRRLWHPLRDIGRWFTSRPAGRIYRTVALFMCWVPTAFSAGVAGNYMAHLKEEELGPVGWLGVLLLVCICVAGIATTGWTIAKARRSAYIAHITYLDGGDPLPSLLLAAAWPITALSALTLVIYSPRELGPWGQATHAIAQLLWNMGEW